MAEKEYTVVAPDGKEITLIGPAGASQEEVIAQAQKLYKPTASTSPVKSQETNPVMDKLKALYEVPTTVVTGAVAPFLGAGKGIIQNIRQGTNERVDRPELAQEFVYQPTSPVSQDILESMGKTLDSAKIPAYVPGAGDLGRSVKQGLQFNPLPSYALSNVNKVKPAVNRLAEALREEPTSTLSGVGAAKVPEAETRIQMAQNLRVPLKLTKGQATKDLGQLQFEAETAKTYPQDVGKPLIENKLDQNQKILSNFDAYVEATGAEIAAPNNLYEVGKIVDKALVTKAKQAKTEIKNAYQKARDAGETAELVDVTPVQKFLAGLEAESINAPIIKSAEVKLNSLAKDGKLSINDLEEVRKMVGNLSGSTPTNMLYGKQINQLIDSTTENLGGQLYKDARALRAKYAREFENVGVVDKLLSKKPGTTDRSVALEDVFNHSVLKGSLDDVRAMGRTLKKAGPEGEQAWKELQGQTIEQMREAITKNIAEDAIGNRTVSPKQFDTFVNNLDRDGKLDYLFGKKGAQEIRDLRDTAITVLATPQGINTSNTASALTQALDKIKSSALSKIPMAGPLFEVGAEALEKKKIAKQVEQSLEFNPKDLAKGLKKENK